MARDRLDLYQRLGGTDGCRKLSAALYSHLAPDPALRHFFPGKSQRCAIEAFAAFLFQFLEGPPEDSQDRWFLSLRESHGRFAIGNAEREAWMRGMARALAEVEIEEPVRDALLGFFAKSSGYIVNRGAATSVEEAPRDWACQHARWELERRWDVQLGLDEAVAAVSSGDSGRAIAVAERSALKERRGVSAQLLGMMIGSGNGPMLEYVRTRLSEDRELAAQRFAGHTLLHMASGAGEVSTVELLLELGVDANIQDEGGHTPLYSVGNQCTAEGGGSVVRALVKGGAAVDACEGVKRCTPLHMAARRGNVAVAAALLDCGADIEARDSYGDTPLRRAVNCAKPEVAAFLVSKGADVQSPGSKGLTPLSAARSDGMRRTLLRDPVRPPARQRRA